MTCKLSSEVPMGFVPANILLGENCGERFDWTLTAWEIENGVTEEDIEVDDEDGEGE
jgi:hypothetical protein